MQRVSQVDIEISKGDRVPLGFGDLYASPGDHIGHFYDSSEEEKNVLVSFLKTGIEAGEKCVCLMGPGSKHLELREALADAGIDVEHTVASGQLTLDNGKSEPEELRQILREAMQDIPEKYPLLRWVGVMSWALKKIPTGEKLMEWESHCNCVDDLAAFFLCGADKLTSRLVFIPGMHDLCGRSAIPRRKGTLSEYSIVLSRYQMPPEIEMIIDSSVRAQKPLGLIP